MDPKYIAEVWQAMSVLSDAQEFLGDESFPALDPGSSPGQVVETRIARANERINHAKRHLTQALDWWSREHQQAFVRGTLVMDCTLPGEESSGTHQALQDR